MSAFLRCLPAYLAAAAAALVLVSPVEATTGTKTVITRLSDLPTYTYALPSKPSVMVRDSAAVKALAAAIEKDIRSDLETYDIQDVTAVRRMHGTLLTIAMLKGDYAGAHNQVARVREMQEKPAAKLASGRMTEALITAHQGPADAFGATLRSNLEAALAALPWDVVQDNLQSTKGYLEFVSEGLVIGDLETSLDPPAAESGKLSQQLAENILGAAYTLSFVIPAKDILHAAYAAVVDAHKETLKPDIWAARDVVFGPADKLTPVRVAVWDSGVDFGIGRSVGRLL